MLRRGETRNNMRQQGTSYKQVQCPPLQSTVTMNQALWRGCVLVGDCHCMHVINRQRPVPVRADPPDEHHHARHANVSGCTLMPQHHSRAASRTRTPLSSSAPAGIGPWGWELRRGRYRAWLILRRRAWQVVSLRTVPRHTPQPTTPHTFSVHLDL